LLSRCAIRILAVLMVVATALIVIARKVIVLDFDTLTPLLLQRPHPLPAPLFPRTFALASASTLGRNVAAIHHQLRGGDIAGQI